MASMLDVDVYSSLRPSTTTTATKSAKLEEEEDDELIFDQYEEEVTEEEDESVVAKEQIEEKSNDDELEYLTNSLIMFIVDSRQQPIQGRSILTVCHKPSYLFDRFVAKLTAEAFALSGGDYSMSLLPLDYSCPKSSQCEIARRLKSKIEKCMQEHSNVLTRVVSRQRQRTTTRRRSSIIKKPQQQQPSIEQHEQKDDHNHNESQSYHGYGTTTTLTTTSTTLKTKKFSYTQPHPVSSDIDYEDVERRSYHHHHHHQSDCQFLRILDGPVLDVRAATSNKSSLSFSSSTQIVIDVYLLAECCYLDLLTSTSSSHHSRHLSSSNNSSCSISCSDLSSILNHPPLLLIQPFNSISNTTTNTTTSSLQSDCSGASQCCTSTYSLPSSTFELLERWTISMITSKKNDDNSTQSSTTAANSAKSLLKVNELFQAIRSYLHFSQISSWISQQPSGSGQQQLPPVKNIAYSISWRQTNENDLTTTTATRISEEKKSGNDCTSISGTVNEDETIKCQSSQPLPSAEFDAQTFPILNLLFANNKLVLSQQQQQQQSQSQSQSSRVKSSLAISQIRIDLESRKRSFFSNTTTLGIPSLVCLIHPPKPNEETLNLTTMNKTAPVPIHPTPSTITYSSFWSSLLVSPDSPSTQTLTPGSYTTTTATTTNNSNHLEKESKNEAENDEPRTPTTTTTTSLLGLLTPASTPSQKPSTSSLVLTTPTQFPGLITAAHLFASPPPQSAASLQPPTSSNSSFNISQSPKVLVSNHQLLMLTTADDMKHLNLTDQNNNRNNEANHNGDVNRLDKVNISAEKKAENGIKPQQQININKRKQLHLNLNPPHNDCNINANVDISWPQPQQQTNGSHHHNNHHYNHHYNNNHHHQNNDLNNMSHNNDKSSKSLRIDCSNVDVDIDNNANNVINMIKSTGEQEFVVAATNQNRESSTNNNNKHLLLKKPEQESTNDVVQTTQLCNRHHASTYSCFPSVVGDGDNNSSNNSNCSSSSSNKQPQPQQQQQPVKSKVINKSTRCYFQLSSSPAPLRKSGSSFDFDNTLKDPKSIKNALTLNNKCTNNIANNNAKQSTTNGDNSNSNSSSQQVIISAAEIEKETTTAVAEKKTVDENEDRIIESGEQNGDNENENHHHELSEYMIDDNSSVKTMKHQHNSSNNSQHRSLRDTMHKSSTIANLQFSYSNTNLASSMPITPNCLLGSFEESLLNGRMNPVGIVDGFYAEIGASGAFFPEHVTLPVYAAFYQVCEDVAASPYLGIINLNNLASKRGYRVPTKGTIQVTLFNPNKTVVKMFVVMYDLSDMPASHRTFLRQRTMYVPLKNSSSSSSSSINSGSSTIASNNDDEDDSSELKSYLRYLIHLRFSTSKSGKLYLHTNVKLIFARNKCEIDPRLARYEYKTFTEAPNHPKYSPKR